MKTLLSTLLGLSLISGIAFANSAKKEAKKRKAKAAASAPAVNPEDKKPEATAPVTNDATPKH